MGRISQESIRLVVEASDIVDVIGTYIQLRRSGSSFKALCPFHNEKSPSFHVTPTKQAYYCFGCHAGGGVVQFVMDYEKLDFPAAIRKLADRAGIRIIEELGSEDSGSSKGERTRLVALHQLAATQFHDNLMRNAQGEPARAYLKTRSFHSQTAKNWQLGYALPKWDTFCKIALAKGFSRHELLASGLAVTREENGPVYDRFRGRLMIPITDESGAVVAFSGRLLEPNPKAAKYVNSPETPIFSKGRILFGLSKSKRALIDSSTAIVCEGQLDVIRLYESGVQNVIAPQGTAFTAHQALVLKRLVERVILCFDSDQAGMNATERSLPALLANNLEVRVIRLPAGTDPDSFVSTHGVDAFKDYLSNAQDILDFLIATLRQFENLQSPQGVGRAAEKIAQTLSHIPNIVTREKAAMLAATQLGVSPSAITSAIRKAPPTPQLASDDIEPDRAEPLARLQPTEELLCKLALTSEDARVWMQKHILNQLPQDYTLLKKILVKWNDENDASAIDQEQPSGFAFLIANFNPQEQRLFAQLDFRHPPTDPVQAAKDAWTTLRKQQLTNHLQTLSTNLRQPSITPDKILSIQKEMLDLRRELQDISPLTSI